jgi:hypothetical protein
MIGVTIFGLIFTPVFYVISRRLGERRRPATPPSPQTKPAKKSS